MKEKSFVAAVFGSHIAPCDQPADPEQFARDLVGKLVLGWRFASILFGQSEQEDREQWRIVRTEIIRDVPNCIGLRVLNTYNQVIAYCEKVESNAKND